jgi:glucose-6-phosphate isomerase
MAQHQPELLANALAQAQALTQGVPPSAGGKDVPAHRQMPGNRPSTTLLLDALTPRSFGALLALYEHRVFVQATLWGINPFDQWGVELGKTLATTMGQNLKKTESEEKINLDSASLLTIVKLNNTK